MINLRVIIIILLFNFKYTPQLYSIVPITIQSYSPKGALFNIIPSYFFTRVYQSHPFFCFLTRLNQFRYQLSFSSPTSGRWKRDMFNPRYFPFTYTWMVVKFIYGLSPDFAQNKWGKYTPILLILWVFKPQMALNKGWSQTWVNVLLSTSFMKVINWCMFCSLAFDIPSSQTGCIRNERGLSIR